MFDLIIAGGGPAGYAAAIRTAQLGGKVLMVERDKVGGTCLHRGCIPTKVLYQHAASVEQIRSGLKNGFLKGELTLDLTAVPVKQQEVISRLHAGLQHVLKTKGIEIIHGTAEVVFPGTLVLKKEKDSAPVELKASNILIATGSREAELNISGSQLLTKAEEALQPPQVPCRVAVIGGGNTGLELASSYASLGFEVTVLEKEKVIIPALEDPELNKVLAFLLKRRGIKILTGVSVTGIEPSGDEILLTINTSSGEQKLVVQRAVSAVGRLPNLEVLGSGMEGIQTNSQGIMVNERQDTGVPHVYAAGDVTGPPLLAHLSYFEGITAAENIMGGNKILDRSAIPFFMAADPGLAWVGITEQQAKKMKIPYKVGRFPFSANGRALVKGKTEGLVKVVVRESDGVLLGMQVLGSDAEDLIIEGVLAVQHQLTAGQMAETIHPHPTLGEAAWESYLTVMEKALHG